MPTTLTIGVPVLAKIEWVSPRGLAVVQIADGSHTVATICHLVGSQPLPGYEAVCEKLITEALSPGTMVRVVPSGVEQEVGSTQGDAQLAPVLEAMTTTGHSLSESLISRGWALSTNWDVHTRHKEISNSLALARKQHQGIWGESTTVADQMAIPGEILKETEPRQEASPLLSSAGILLVLGLMGALALREAQWRQREKLAGEGDKKRPGLIRRFLRTYAGVRPGMLRPIEADQPQDGQK